MVRQGGDNPQACLELRARVLAAIEALRASGPNGSMANRSIAKEAAK
jgi:hypothetical protein